MSTPIVDPSKRRRTCATYTPEERAAIVAAWHEAPPRSSADTVAALASARLGRAIPRRTAHNFKPADMIASRTGRKRPAPPATLPMPAASAAAPESPLSGLIREARAVRRRLGIGRPAAQETRP